MHFNYCLLLGFHKFTSYESTLEKVFITIMFDNINEFNSFIWYFANKNYKAN